MTKPKISPNHHLLGLQPAFNNLGNKIFGLLKGAGGRERQYGYTIGTSISEALCSLGQRLQQHKRFFRP